MQFIFSGYPGCEIGRGSFHHRRLLIFLLKENNHHFTRCFLYIKDQTNSKEWILVLVAEYRMSPQYQEVATVILLF
jgi:hypothetical protein